MKKQLLFVYSSMMIGGSTTALLGLLNTIDYNEYDVDLLLYKAEGPMLKYVPKEVNILPAARKTDSKVGRIFKMLFSGHLIPAFFHNLKYKKKLGLMSQDLAFAKNSTCRRLNKQYDAAIGGLELWPNAYVNEMADAKARISWIHTDYTKVPYIPCLEEHSLQKSDYIICVSPSLTEQFKQLMPSVADKVHTLENILSTKLVRRMAEEEISDTAVFDRDGFKIITVARLDISSKRLDRAIRVLARLRKDGIPVTWYVVGDGPDRATLEALIAEENVQDSFILLGARSNPYPYLKHCNLFALVSDYEGKPVSVTEAQILGLPTVVTSYETAPLQVTHGVNGLIAKTDEDGVYEALRSLLTDSVLFRTLSQNAATQDVKEHMETYDTFIKMCNRQGV